MTGFIHTTSLRSLTRRGSASAPGTTAQSPSCADLAWERQHVLRSTCTTMKPTSTLSTKRSTKPTACSPSEETMPGLEDLYREIILDHYRNPRNRGELAAPPALRVEGFNPL